MCLSGELLLATGNIEADRNTETGCVLARSTATGAEVFRVSVPGSKFDPAGGIQEIAGLFLVQDLKGPSDAAVALLLDRTGRVRHQFDREVVTVIRRAESYLVLTNRDVTLLPENGKLQWPVPFERDEWLADGGLLALSTSDVVAFRYCPGADSGVRVMRLNADKGKKTWEIDCSSLGVTHSGYNHAADVVEKDGRLIITSRGSGGEFVEVLDANTGQQISRKTR